MTATTIHTRDPNMVQSSIDAQSRQARERFYDEIISNRIKMGYSLKLPDATRNALVRHLETLLVDVFELIDLGVVISHKSNRLLPKVAVYISQISKEEFKSREECFTTLVADFKEYIQ